MIILVLSVTGPIVDGSETAQLRRQLLDSFKYDKQVQIDVVNYDYRIGIILLYMSSVHSGIPYVIGGINTALTSGPSSYFITDSENYVTERSVRQVDFSSVSHHNGTFSDRLLLLPGMISDSFDRYH